MPNRQVVIQMDVYEGLSTEGARVALRSGDLGYWVDAYNRRKTGLVYLGFLDESPSEFNLTVLVPEPSEAQGYRSVGHWHFDRLLVAQALNSPTFGIGTLPFGMGDVQIAISQAGEFMWRLVTEERTEVFLRGPAADVGVFYAIIQLLAPYKEQTLDEADEAELARLLNAGNPAEGGEHRD